ncbi:mitochondrial distribution and morphology [Blastocladiella emersonii ATCC 22665]|nr:mitochondrial distribution and morphology [Blastocladiella emersonii ATCC 22665]
MGKQPRRPAPKKPAGSAATKRPAPASAPAAPTPTTKNVADWQLRPIYESLDNWDNKTASQAAAKLLKKYPKSQILRALHAVAIVRLGNREEAEAEIAQLLAEKPTDIVVMQTMLFSLRALDKRQEIVQMYQAALEANPADEEVATHLFMAHVRVLDFAGMQSVAVTFKEHFPNDVRYYFWHVVTTYLQALHPTDDADPAILLDLCERLVRKAEDADLIHTAEQLGLFLDILKANGADAVALKAVLDRHVGVLKLDEDKWRLMLEFLPPGDEMLDVTRQVLEKNPDDWYAWTKYLDSAAATNLETPAIHGFIDATKRSTGGAEARGVYLAKLELAKRDGATDETALLEYWTKFGHKPAFFADVAQFLTADYAPAVAGIEHAVQCSPKSIARGINLRKMRRYLALDVASQDLLAALLEEYDTAHEIDEDLLDTEPRHADGFLALLVLYLLECDGVAYPVHQAIALLETGVARSPANHQFKLLLICLYQELGAAARARFLFDRLEIKSVQLDTLSHNLLERLGATGHFDRALTLGILAASIYSSNARDTPDQVALAFQYSSLTKVPEFIRFHHRLDRSLSRYVGAAELWRWELLRAHRDGEKGVRKALLAEIPPPLPLDLTGSFDNREKNVVHTFRPADDANARAFPDRATMWTATDVAVVAGAQAVLRNVYHSDMEQLARAVEVLAGIIAERDDTYRFWTMANVAHKLGCALQLTASTEDESPEMSALLTGVLATLQAAVDACPRVDSLDSWTGATFTKWTTALETINHAIVACHLHPHISEHQCAVHPASHDLRWLRTPFIAFVRGLDALLVEFGEAVIAHAAAVKPETAPLVDALTAAPWAENHVPTELADRVANEYLANDWNKVVDTIAEEVEVKRALLAGILKQVEKKGGKA